MVGQAVNGKVYDGVAENQVNEEVGEISDIGEGGHDGGTKEFGDAGDEIADIAKSDISDNQGDYPSGKDGNVDVNAHETGAESNGKQFITGRDVVKNRKIPVGEVAVEHQRFKGGYQTVGCRCGQPEEPGGDLGNVRIQRRQKCRRQQADEKAEIKVAADDAGQIQFQAGHDLSPLKAFPVWRRFLPVRGRLRFAGGEGGPEAPGFVPEPKPKQ